VHTGNCFDTYWLITEVPAQVTLYLIKV